MIQLTTEELNKAYSKINTLWKEGYIVTKAVYINVSEISDREEYLTPQYLTFNLLTFTHKDKWVLQTEVSIIDEELV